MDRSLSFDLTARLDRSADRMIGALAGTGLVEARADPAGGNRRSLRLTPSGEKLAGQCRELLERRFADLVERSGVPYVEYARHTRQLMAALDMAEQAHQ